MTTKQRNILSDPMDDIVEKDLKKSRKSNDPYLNSIDPPGLEGSGLGKGNEEFIEFERGEEKEELKKDSEGYSEDSFDPEEKLTQRKKKTSVDKSSQ